MNEFRSKYSAFIIYIVLLVLSIVAILFPVVSDFGLSFTFPTIFLLIILSMRGFPVGLFSAFIVAGTGLALGGPWMGALLLVMEILVVGLLLKYRKWGIYYSVILYWLMVGLPLFSVYIYLICGLDGWFAILALISKMLNNILCALAAEIIVTYVHFDKWVGARVKRYSIRYLISHVVLLAVILPYAIFLIGDLEYTEQQMERSVTSNLQGQAKVITNELGNWDAESILALQLHGYLQVAKMNSLMKNIDGQNLNIYILDKENHVVYTNLPPAAKEPSVKFKGEGHFTTIGRDSYRWAKQKPDGIRDVAIIDGTSYLHSVQFGPDSMRLLIEVPLRQLFGKEVQGFALEYANLLLFISIGIGLTFFLRKYIMSTFNKLSEVTTGLPSKLKESGNINWPNTRMIEFNKLTENFMEMSSELTIMFDELQVSRNSLHHMAYTDSLTGVKNRTYFMDALKDAVDKASVEKPLALLYMDLNGFKGINDMHGHDAGDTVLKAVASRLMAACGEAGLVARLGGDEFVMMLTDSSKKEAAQIASSVIKLIGMPIDVNGKPLHVGISIGISGCTNDSCSVDELMLHSDMAMYAAKATKTERMSSYTIFGNYMEEGEEEV